MAIHIRRREFVFTLGGAAAGWPLEARAQQSDRMPRIGVLMGYGENDPDSKAMLSAFTHRLRELSWTEGRNVRMDLRWASGNIDQMRLFAKELVDLQPAVILAQTTPVTAALQRETRTIPIVFVIVVDPIGSGFVASLPQPGGNLTGFINLEASMAGKWLELLKEIAPGVTHAALMFNPTTAPRGGTYHLSAAEVAAQSLAVKPIAAPVHNDGEIEKVINSLGREPGGGLVVMPDGYMVVHRATIILAAARNNVPAVYKCIILRQGRRFTQLRTRRAGHLSALGVLCRSHSTWCKAGRLASSAAGEICDVFKHQDRQGARPHRPTIAACPRRSSDRIEMRFAAVHESVHGRFCCRSRR